uniref:EAL domain-containing protein n=1 Tax=Ascaris lumbricoides TaxID=6252 RepID=A0A0M3I1C8_ASCLU
MNVAEPRGDIIAHPVLAQRVLFWFTAVKQIKEETICRLELVGSLDHFTQNLNVKQFPQCVAALDKAAIVAECWVQWHVLEVCRHADGNTAKRLEMRIR